VREVPVCTLMQVLTHAVHCALQAPVACALTWRLSAFTANAPLNRLLYYSLPTMHMLNRVLASTTVMTKVTLKSASSYLYQRVGPK
jgi:hypothetical protein